MARETLAETGMAVTLSHLPQALAPFTTQCVGIDISQGMVDVYNSKVNGQVGNSRKQCCGHSSMSRGL